MEATKLLMEDHRVVDEMLEQCQTGPCSADLVQELSRELSIHAAIEETELYPLMRQSVPNADHLIDHALAEHQTVKELLAEIEALTPGTPDFNRKIEKLASGVREHVREEESKLFPLLRQRIPPAELDTLGAKLESAKSTAPTRPHPAAPNQPPANKIVGVAAGVVDRIRDTFEDR